MDRVRDLARNDLWEDSLERSRARREAQRVRSRPEAQRMRSRREVPAPKVRSHGRREVVAPEVRSRRLVPAGAGLLVPASAGLLVLVLLALVLSGAFAGSRAGRLAAHRPAVRPEQGGPTYADSVRVPAISHSLVSRGGSASAPRSCRSAAGASNYFNPLAAAKVTPERIDQGVDYAGTGTLGAIGAARITYVATTGTGWPGAFLEYRLLDGVDAGCYVYYAEGVKPAPGLRAGQIVGPGQPVASIIPGWSTGIELGWGAGYKTVTYAAARHQWSARSDADSVATGAGKGFSSLISALGGPPGKLEGP